MTLLVEETKQLRQNLAAQQNEVAVKNQEQGMIHEIRTEVQKLSNVVYNMKEDEIKKVWLIKCV